MTAEGWIAAARTCSFLLATYTVQAALWAGAAAVLGRGARHSCSARHSLWRLALFGSLVTTAVAASGAISRGFVDLEDLSARAAGPALPFSATSATGGAMSSFSWLGRLIHLLSWTTFQDGKVPVVVGSSVLAAGLFGVGRWVSTALRFAHEVRGRLTVEDCWARARFDALVARTKRRRVRLTSSARLASPIALGRREICLPSSLVSRLDDAELDGVLAHELAHLERGDGIWLPALAIVRAAFWFHPVVRWMAAQASRTAELACDDRAIELTRDPLGLARALTRVAAEWVEARPRLLPAIAGTDTRPLRGQLSSRVHRLVTAEDLATPLGRALSLRGREAWLLGALALLLSLWPLRVPAPPATLLLPGIRSTVTARSSIPSHGEPPSSSPVDGDAAALTRTMHELAEREREVTLHLAAARAAQAPAAVSAVAEPQIQALEQDLRHLRALQAWTEERLVTATEPPANRRRP